MRKFLLLCLLVMAARLASASAGDTTVVRSHNAVHMNWYGSYDRWAVFPSDTASFRKITLKFTLGCPGAGCSDWDYTTKVFVRHRTGAKDSTLMSSPHFTVNGNALDSVLFATDTTYTHFYDSTAMATDSSANAPLVIIQYNDSLNPTVPTDTLWYWPAAYWNYDYDNTGAIIDSMMVTADSTWYQQNWSWYNVFDVIEEVEIARMITPYGGNLTGAWTRMFKMDVTDYWPILQDSVELRVFYDGWSDGFTVTLDFEMIKGTPPREAFEVVNLWNGGFPYGDPNNSIENYLNAKSVTIDPLAAAVRLRILQTGHGFGGNQDCAEFCPKNNYIKVNNNQVFSNLVWRDNCGENPHYPQPGTWLYDRANWCPGADVWPYIHELTPLVSAGQTYSLDMDMDPFTNVGNNNCSYNVGSHLIYYTAPTHTLDAEMWDILAPSDFAGYTRFNPICRQPRVVIRNAGTTALTSCTITYGVIGGPVQTYQWTGNLAFLDTVSVVLGNIDWFTPTYQKKFYAVVSNPNAQADQYAANDRMESSYNIPPSIPSDFILVIKTNSAGWETSYELIDEQNNVLVSRSGLSANTYYRDTMHLQQGCYQFRLYDAGKDGLNFWANNAGTGSARIATLNNSSIKTFNADFGSSIVYNFTTGYTVNVEEEISNELGIYPNPASDKLMIDLASNAETLIRVFDASGRLVMQQESRGVGEQSLDVSSLPAGLYSVQVSAGGKQLQKRVVITR
jgi:hypothetical protein